MCITHCHFVYVECTRVCLLFRRQASRDIRHNESSGQHATRNGSDGSGPPVPRVRARDGRLNADRRGAGRSVDAEPARRRGAAVRLGCVRRLARRHARERRALSRRGARHAVASLRRARPRGARRGAPGAVPALRPARGRRHRSARASPVQSAADAGTGTDRAGLAAQRARAARPGHGAHRERRGGQRPEGPVVRPSRGRASAVRFPRDRSEPRADRRLLPQRQRVEHPLLRPAAVFADRSVRVSRCARSWCRTCGTNRAAATPR